ncbi:polymorphic toxin type 35 domain-containing protein [Caloranaerobacter sp. DY30410]|uniref:polymorphic toxin type 35 domain-containing protein n=1 Tax=Caloranaerobacter sp. DY30410 TaxID=3238305 RepID=UPI003CFE394E
MKKLLSLFLVLTLVFGAISTSFAQSDINAFRVKYYDDIVYTIKTLDGKTLTQEEFMEYLEKYSDQIVKIDEVGGKNVSKNGLTTMSVPGAVALVAGTWYIPGIGQVIITAAGVVIIGGTVIAAGTWLYNKVVAWFEQRAEAKIIDKALKDLDRQPNKQKHIKDPKHDWDKIIKGAITWEKVRNIIEKVMKKGIESRYGSAYKRVLKVGKETVTVTFQKINDNIWKISDAWVNKK